MPKPPLRLAILECDSPLPNTSARFGSYGGVFEHLLLQGAKQLSRDDPAVLGDVPPEKVLEVTKWAVEQDPTRYPDLGDVDAILLTGSRHDSFADNEWTNTLVAFTQKVLAQKRVRTIGVCYGHQIIARALGMKVGRNDDGWEAAVTDVNLSEKGRELFGKDTLAIHQMHRDIAFPSSSPTPLPPPIMPLGSSPVCSVQGMHEPNRLLTIQGHPEFNSEIMEEILETRHATGIFNDEAYEMYMKKVDLPHDGVLVGAAFLRFLFEG